MKIRPAGVAVVGSILITIGGFLTTVITISVIDSITRFGLRSLSLASPLSLLGFFVYGLSPLLFYATGINLFTAKRWAWFLTVSVVPASGFAMFFNWAAQAARRQSGLIDPGMADLLTAHMDIFLRFMAPYALIFLPIVYYFSREPVLEYFRSPE